MQFLGYPATWPTSCFISGGFGEIVFAPTNGFGDFMLFDEPGPPWPVHEYYSSRFLLNASGRLIVRDDSTRGVSRRPNFRSNRETKNVERTITKIEPMEYVAANIFWRSDRCEITWSTTLASTPDPPRRPPTTPAK